MHSRPIILTISLSVVMGHVVIVVVDSSKLNVLLASPSPSSRLWTGTTKVYAMAKIWAKCSLHVGL